jgi:hypothetical protein
MAQLFCVGNAFAGLGLADHIWHGGKEKSRKEEGPQLKEQLQVLKPGLEFVIMKSVEFKCKKFENENNCIITTQKLQRKSNGS